MNSFINTNWKMPSSLKFYQFLSKQLIDPCVRSLHDFILSVFMTEGESEPLAFNIMSACPFCKQPPRLGKLKVTQTVARHGRQESSEKPQWLRFQAGDYEHLQQGFSHLKRCAFSDGSEPFQKGQASFPLFNVTVCLLQSTRNFRMSMESSAIYTFLILIFCMQVCGCMQTMTLGASLNFSPLYFLREGFSMGLESPICLGQLASEFQGSS